MSDIGVSGAGLIVHPAAAAAFKWWPFSCVEPAQVALVLGLLLCGFYLLKVREKATLATAISVLVTGGGVFLGVVGLVISVAGDGVPSDFRIFWGAGGLATVWVGFAEFLKAMKVSATAGTVPGSGPKGPDQSAPSTPQS